MTILCLGALMAGLIAAPVLPFVPFACAVMVAIVLGSTSMVIGGSEFGQTCLSALALLFTSQIGYGLGLVAVVVATQGVAAFRRGGTEKQAQPPARPFQTGNEPR